MPSQWNQVELSIQKAIDEGIQNFIWDLDDTLIKGNCGAFYVKHLFQKGELDLWPVLKVPFYKVAYRLGWLNYEKLVHYGMACIKHLSLDELHNFGLECFKEKVLQNIRPEALRCLEIIKKGKGTNVLLSSSPPPILEAVSRELELPNLSTQLQVVDKHYTGKIIGTPCFGEGKLKKLRSHLGQKPYMAFGDSGQDIPMMSRASIAVAVCPDRALRTKAHKENWLVVNS
jgi:HAD superfamily phosphoserine phosphatase-like hydrolase